MDKYFCAMIRTANVIKLFRQICWVLLLALYAAASLKVDSFHELFHAQEIKELHSAEQESNPCHKSVYHQQTENGCEHKSHITENTKCSLCEFNVTPDQLADELAAESEAKTVQPKQTVWLDAEPASVNISLSSRAPPAGV
jgi:ferredoxin